MCDLDYLIFKRGVAGTKSSVCLDREFHQYMAILSVSTSLMALTTSPRKNEKPAKLAGKPAKSAKTTNAKSY